MFFPFFQLFLFENIYLFIEMCYYYVYDIIYEFFMENKGVFIIQKIQLYVSYERREIEQILYRK